MSEQAETSPMRALVTSAFVLTLLLSALVIVLALRSDSLDGEPSAAVTVKPPSAFQAERTSSSSASTRSTSTTQSSGQLQPVTPATQTDPARNAAVSEPEPASGVVMERQNVEAGSATTQTVSGDQPTLTPRPVAEEVKTRVVQPVSETIQATEQTITNELVLPNDPNVGIGVGSLGPLEPASQ